MHELSIARAIVATAAAHASGRRVARVDLRIGRLRQVAPESLDFYFGVAARGTPCEAAVLHHVVVPARLRCRDCCHEWQLDLPDFTCPECGNADVELVSGEELEVESIEVEEDGCTARK